MIQLRPTGESEEISLDGDCNTSAKQSPVEYRVSALLGRREHEPEFLAGLLHIHTKHMLARRKTHPDAFA